MALALLLVAAMVGAAQEAGASTAIFPEFGALICGLVVLDLAAWKRRPGDLMIFPTTAALGAVLLNRLGAPYWAVDAVVFAFALGTLNLLGSAVVPTIGVGLLPVLLHYTSWAYPIAVGCWTTLLAVAVQLGSAKGRGAPTPGSSPGALPTLSFLLLGWGWSTAAWAVGERWLAVPPLLAAGYELLQAGGAGAVRKSALLGVAAGIGAVARLALPWKVGAGAVSFLAVAGLARLAAVASPPAAAMSLLPLVLPRSAMAAFVWSSGIGSLLLLAVFAAAAGLRRRRSQSTSKFVSHR
ncbi:MAG: hypothetical protein M0Z27_13685 [Thermaerobacter sp.]|nr:hypothetical protein [Thermaerobacter sp.]